MTNQFFLFSHYNFDFLQKAIEFREKQFPCFNKLDISCSKSRVRLRIRRSGIQIPPGVSAFFFILCHLTWFIFKGVRLCRLRIIFCQLFFKYSFNIRTFLNLLDRLVLLVVFQEQHQCSFGLMNTMRPLQHQWW